MKKLVFMCFLLFSCTRNTSVATWADFSPEEKSCIALKKAQTAEEIDRCGKNVTGECATRSIYERERERLASCVR